MKESIRKSSQIGVTCRCNIKQCWFERRFEWCYDGLAEDLMFSVTVSENILVSAYILGIKTNRFDKGVKQYNKN